MVVGDEKGTLASTIHTFLRSNGVLYVGYAMWEVLHGPGIAPIFGGACDVSFTYYLSGLHNMQDKHELRRSTRKVVKSLLYDLVCIILYASVVFLPLAVYQRWENCQFAFNLI